MAWIELDGAVNVRDLGGMEAAGGRHIAPGQLLRSDNLQDLSPADVRKLVHDIGVSTVVDLRSTFEVQAEGPGPLTREPSVRHAHHSVLPEQGAATDAAADSSAETAGDADSPAGGAAADPQDSFDAGAALAVRRRDGALARFPGDIRVGYYVGYLQDRPEQVVAALRSVAQAPGAALVHCAAGKDRTGVVIAMALTAVGAGRDAVIADYAATGERMNAVLARLRSSATYAEDTNSRTDEDYMPQPQTMAGFLDVVQESYGGVLPWLRQHGFSDDDLATLRAKLLAPPAATAR